MTIEVEVSNADDNVAEKSPTEMVEELAARKAEAVVNLHNKKEDNCLVIGADTIVVLDGKFLESHPTKQMLERCSPLYPVGHIRCIQE